MITILASGQSNMCGRGLDGPSPSTVNSLVQVWDNENELGGNGAQFISPPDFGNDPWSKSPFNEGNNLSVWFAHRLAQEMKDDVRLVLVCKGGEPIASWDKATGALYQEISDVYSLTGLSGADIFLWHQGENDGSGGSGTSKTAYKTAFLTLLSDLKTDGFLDGDALSIVGELRSTNAATINTALQELATENNDVYFADATGLNDYDGTHFTGPSLVHFGYYRYWKQYRDHMGIDRKNYVMDI